MTQLILFAVIVGFVMSVLITPFMVKNKVKRKVTEIQQDQEGDSRKVKEGKTSSFGLFISLGILFSVIVFVVYYATNFDRNLSLLVVPVLLFSAIGASLAGGIEGKLKGLVALGALVFSIYLFSAPIWNANDKFAAVEMTEEVEIKPFDETKKPASVPPQFVRNKMKKAFGQVPNTSYYELGHLQIQKVKGEYVYIAPVEFSGLFKWFNGKTVPGYFTMSATDSADNPRFVKEEMSYTPSSYFHKQVERHMRMDYPNLIYYGDAQLEVDDDGKPFYIRSYGSFISARNGFDVEGIVMVDTQTGQTQKFELKDIPAFIDGAVSPEAVSLQNSYYGKYVHGFWNSLFGKKDVKIPSDEGTEASVNPVFDENGQMFYFTDFTSPKEEVDSMLGYALTDARTGEATYYTGNLEESYMDSEGALQIIEKKFIEKRWGGEMPVLYNFFGEASWLTPVLDSNGFLQNYFIVSAANPEISVYANSPKEALKLYKTALQRGGSTVDAAANAEIEKAVITVERVYKEAHAEFTLIYILATDGKSYLVSTELDPTVVFIEKGDELSIEYGNTGDGLLPITLIQ